VGVDARREQRLGGLLVAGHQRVATAASAEASDCTSRSTTRRSFASAEVEQRPGMVGVAAADVAHAGVDGVDGGGEGTGGEVADAGGGAGDEDDGWRGLLQCCASACLSGGSPGQARPPLV
jgi:hypothetical protein